MFDIYIDLLFLNFVEQQGHISKDFC
jgi:hypothetical protein